VLVVYLVVGVGLGSDEVGELVGLTVEDVGVEVVDV
jgi:hypothetical protein